MVEGGRGEGGSGKQFREVKFYLMTRGSKWQYKLRIHGICQSYSF